MGGKQSRETAAEEVPDLGGSGERSIRFSKKVETRRIMRTESENEVVHFASESDLLSGVNEVSLEGESLCLSDLGERLSRVLASEKERNETPRHLTKILLKFPVIRSGFGKLREAFSSVDTDGNGEVDFREWSSALTLSGVDGPGDLIHELWKEADNDKSETIGFREFVLVVAILYLMDRSATGHAGKDASKSKDGLGKKQGKKSKKLQLVSSTDSARSTSSPVMLKGKPIVLSEEVQQSIDLVVEAFLFFDRDGDGVIDRNEVISTFDTEAGVSRSGNSSTRGGKGPAAASVWRKRFAEMKCCHDHFITFTEFLLAFEDWVGLQDEADEESEED